MSNRIGSSTIHHTTLPNNASLARIQDVRLSKVAKHRLRIIEHYQQVTRNVSLTCRHFAITRSYFYKWFRRYDPKHLASLESRSTRPRRVRLATYDVTYVKLIRTLRTDYLSYSAKKLARIVRRDYEYHYSAATIGRIIKRFALYFRAAVLLSKRRSQYRKQIWKQRKPYLLKANRPRGVIEFDMKHIYLARQSSSVQAKMALEKTVAIFGSDITIVNDNGCENYKHAYEYLKQQHIVQYFTRPHTPKDKPHVENLIGKRKSCNG